MEIPLYAWLGIGAIALFSAGLLLGMLLRRRRQGAAQREAEELKALLRQSQEELRQYRAHVTHHFTQTADLLQALTADYRAVYAPLAAGAQALCDGQVRALTPEALREHLLTAPSEEGTQAEAPASQPVSPRPAEEGQPPLPEKNHEMKPGSAPAPVHTDTEDT